MEYMGSHLTQMNTSWLLQGSFKDAYKVLMWFQGGFPLNIANVPNSLKI